MSFDTLAPYYRAMEFVAAGEVMQRCRTTFLADVQQCRRALLLGEGPGKFLVELLRHNPRVHVTCVERSPRMMAEAVRAVRRNQLDSARVSFISADALSWQPAGEPFDLVATHFFLDCFRSDELERLLAKVAAHTTAEARWLITDFCVPSRGWRKWRAKMLLAAMYLFFRVMTGLSAAKLPPTDALMRAAGFQLGARQPASFGLAQADLWRKTNL